MVHAGKIAGRVEMLGLASIASQHDTPTGQLSHLRDERQRRAKTAFRNAGDIVLDCAADERHQCGPRWVWPYCGQIIDMAVSRNALRYRGKDLLRERAIEGLDPAESDG